MSDLHDLAAAAGLSIDWEDALGERQHVTDDALVAILAALGFPADGARAIRDSRVALAEDAAACTFVSGDVGQAIVLPPGCGRATHAELVLEDGTLRDVAIGDGGVLPAIDTPGYHRLALADRELRVAVAPPRCFGVGDAASGRRLWGPALQVYALRDGRGTPYGDFATLADSVRAFAAKGADAVAISPTHALFPADPSRYSPYAPSSRLFLNILYADPTLVGGALLDEAGGELIDWAEAIPARLRLLRQAWARAGEQVRDAVAAWADQAGDDLRAHARFDALHAHFFARDGARGWRDWPADYHDPASPAVERFAAEQADEVRFFTFAQWLATQSLQRVQAAARDGGMALGLIADLAVGLDPGGSQAWSRPGDLLQGLSVGAPPDLLGPDGQSWGITGFAPHALRRTGFKPFARTLRTALAHAGGVRVDHALGLHRLWVVPEGASPKQGAFLAMPQDDLFRILAIESQRACAVVIGEDLGTVPDGFRPAMDARGILGMRVLPFERDTDDGLIPPDRWSREAAAMTGTHDLATVAGYWSGRDIDWTWTLGRTSRAKDEADHRAKRDEDRVRWWRAFTAAGAAHRPQPSPDDTAPVVDAADRFIAETPCALAILPMEDVIGLVEQPNLPGTLEEHPNWRRRLPAPTAELLDQRAVAARVAAINIARTE